MSAQIIDKGIATSGLLAQVLVAKYTDDLPLYRQENIFARAGLALPRSTFAQWVGVCGVRLQPLADALRDVVLKRAAAAMSLTQSAKMNWHDPYAYIKDVLTRLPTHKASQIQELLPHRWQPSSTTAKHSHKLEHLRPVFTGRLRIQI